MKQIRQIRQRDLRTSCKPSGRCGFTLIEMIVAVGVVLLMMMLFAQIFEMAAGAISQMKGMAKNDQKVRTITLLMKEDLDHRTFRRIYPFAPGQDTRNFGPYFSPQQRQGYFSISENNPTDPTDDVLAFTARFPDPVAGKANSLNPFPPNPPPNQPEFDDGILNNGIGLSRAVEIVYFLRHGNLYRQVHLIRDAYDDSGPLPPTLTTNYPPTPNPNLRFWRDFDYSAFRIYDGMLSLRLHDIETAFDNSNPPAQGIIPWDNDANPATPPVQLPPSLGIPHLRFGHSLNRLNGSPREFVTNGYIGRFLLRERAHRDFGYPGIGTAAQDPHTSNTLTYDNNTGLVAFQNQLPQRFRRGEDILLTNVHEFDIKVWDDYDEDFNKNGNVDFVINEDLNGNGVLDPGEDSNSNGLLDVFSEDINGNGQVAVDNVLRFVDLGHNLPRTDNAPVPLNQQIGYYHRNNVLNPAFSPLYRYDTWHPFVDPVTSTNLGPPPFRPIRVWNSDDRTPGTLDDDDADGTPNDPSANVHPGPFPVGYPIPPGEEGWLGSDDEAPLQAIQITIRFYDVKSDQMQQLTLVHSLAE